MSWARISPQNRTSNARQIAIFFVSFFPLQSFEPLQKVIVGTREPLAENLRSTSPALRLSPGLKYAY